MTVVTSTRQVYLGKLFTGLNLSGGVFAQETASVYFPFPKIDAPVAEFRLRTDRSAVKIDPWELFSFNSWIYTGERFTLVWYRLLAVGVFEWCPILSGISSSLVLSGACFS